MPGAQLQEVEGDEYRGIVKVKVGPITAQYKGKAMLIEKDESGGRAVLRAEGRDTRGQGNANATITATLTPDGDGTKVVVVTDLTVTGKVAQFGRGVLADVSAKLLGQFVDSLESSVLGGGQAASSAPEPPPAPPAAVSVESSSTEAAHAEAAATTGSATSVATSPSGHENGAVATTVRKIDAPEASPVDLLDAAGASVAKRAVPLIAVVVAVVLVVVWRWRRAS
jgi:carbon monoxide dehydrogenase subunit G